jgi:hypothetical protein
MSKLEKIEPKVRKEKENQNEKNKDKMRNVSSILILNILNEDRN